MANAENRARARAVGINHVALAVADIDAALDFYGRFLDLNVTSRSGTDAFVDMGDQFLALTVEPRKDVGSEPHFGLVVDDVEAARRALGKIGVGLSPGGGGIDFVDPWGNRIQIIGYDDIRFMKAPCVLRGMGLDGLGKTERALGDLADRGMAPE